MKQFKTDEMVKVTGQNIFGRVIATFATTTKIMTRDGEKTFPTKMLELVAAYSRKILLTHPEQALLHEYYAKYQDKNPAGAKFFRLIAEELLALAGWYPGDETWHFTEKSKGGSNLAIRVPAGKTSNLFHLSCHEDSIRVELEAKKKVPPGLESYFPLKGKYFGGSRKDIAGGELNEKYIREYVEVLKKVYKHNVSGSIKLAV